MPERCAALAASNATLAGSFSYPRSYSGTCAGGAATPAQAGQPRQATHGEAAKCAIAKRQLHLPPMASWWLPCSPAPTRTRTRDACSLSTLPPTCSRAQCVFSCSTAPLRKVSQAAIMTLTPFCSSQ